MIQKLTLDHFVKVHEMLAGYYGGTVPNIMGCTLAFKALQQAAPNMTNEQLDYAVMQAMTRCKFMPRIPDLMEELYERNEEHLPKLPDIDPNYADSYQQGIYYRALSERNKAKINAPFNPEKYRDDRSYDIPGILPNPVLCPEDERRELRRTRNGGWKQLREAEKAEILELCPNAEMLDSEQWLVSYENWLQHDCVNTYLPNALMPTDKQQSIAAQRNGEEQAQMLAFKQQKLLANAE